MSILDRLEPRSDGARSVWWRYLEELPADEREALTRAGASREFTHAAFHKAVKAEGVDVGLGTITDWRKSLGYK